ncbi:PQQ-binding-like beta-propeller repeat protein [Isoptericola sp. NPDC019482]|uniref:outer membrane protein assembly factor BamB family protein n=1 Tax=Isoptericola sp. NPDC019482 TaxID=3154688 RepID=UPI003490CC46
MRPRFRRAEPMTTFELVPDDEREGGSGVAPGEEHDDLRRLPLRERALARWRALSRRGRVAVAAGAAVVVLAVATATVAPGLLDARAERLRADAIRGLPGAVEDLSEPLAETWELPDGDGLVTLAGGLVLTTDGTSVAALDAGTGDEAWRREVGTFPTCGPRGGITDDLARPADVAVCLTGNPDDRTVTVLDAGGAVVGERSFGPARADAYDDGAPDGAPVVVPAGGGALAVVDGLSDATAPWPSDDLPDAGTLRALRADGWVDPTVRVEDALTGEVRGEATLHLRAEDLGACGMMQDDGEAPELMTYPSVVASSSLVTLSVCGAAVLVTPRGTAIDVDPEGAWARPLADGGLVVAGEDGSTVLDDDGTVVATVPGLVIPPLVDAEPGSSYLALAGMGDGATGPPRLTSIGPDGGERWWSVVTDDFGGVLARVDGVVVVQDGSGLVGVDAATGDEIWDRDDLLRRSDDGSGEWVAGAVTDGTRLLVGVSGHGGGDRNRLVTLDVRDGTTLWEREQDGYLEGLLTIGGHVVAFAGAVRGLG